MSKAGEWIKSRPMRAWIVLVWLIGWMTLFHYAGSWYWRMVAFTCLLGPLYWQVYLKKDLAPDWW